jgi:hypothetical protein
MAAWSHAVCATVERAPAIRRGDAIERNVNKKTGAGFRAGTNRQFQFPE